MIDEVMIKSQLNTSWAGKNLCCYEEIDSTNREIIRLAQEGAPHGTLAVAESQNAGRGRLGRTWISPAAAGIWMSLLLRPHMAPQSASMITLVAALAVVKGIRECTGLATGIKWPNDVVCEGKKICGILTEMSTDGTAIRYVVPGIGINVNMTEFPETVRETAASLRMLLGEPVKREPLIARIMEAFEDYYGRFLETEDFSVLKEEYNGFLANCGRQVRVLDPKEPYQGTALGIDSQGSLLVRTKDGQVRTVISGEVSVRGIYGYVL